MSLDVASPMAILAPISSNFKGPKPGRSATEDTDISDAAGGFGAVLANIESKKNAIEDADAAKDRRRKPQDSRGSPAAEPVPAQASLEVKVTGATDEDNSQPRVKDTPVVDSCAPTTGNDSPGKDLNLGAVSGVLHTEITLPSALTMPSFGVDLLKVVEPSLTATETQATRTLATALAGVESLTDGFASSPLVVPEAEAPSGFVRVGLSSANLPVATTVLDVKLDAPQQELAPATGFNAPKTALPREFQGAVTAIDPKSFAVANSSKNRLLKANTSTEPLPEGNANLPATATPRVDDLGARARLSQEFKLLIQQANLSLRGIDAADVSLAEPLFSHSDGQFREARSPHVEFRSEGPGTTVDLARLADGSGSSVVSDSTARVLTDHEVNGTQWIFSDLSNAKLKLGDLAEGIVEVSISLQGNQAQVAFQADESGTRAALQDAGSELKEMLRRDGIELSHVSVGTSGFGGNGGQHQGSGGGGRESNPSSLRVAAAELSSTSVLGGDPERLDLFV